MADLIPVQSGDMFGGSGGMGGLFAGMLMANMMRGQGFGTAAEVANGINANADVLQAMNQQQLASSTQILTQDVNHLGSQIATSAGATQMAVANGTLQQTVATLQGQTMLSNAVADSTVQNLNSHTNILQSVAAGNAATSAQINNAQSGLSNDIRAALGVLDADLHGMSAQIDNSIGRTRDDINRANREQIEATHRAEVSGLRGNYDTLKAITDAQYANERAIVTDGAATRSLITQNAIADRDRMIVVAENRLAEALADHRHTRSTSDIIINNNNNATAVANALSAQTQQQQLAALAASQSALANGLTHISQHLSNVTQVSLNANTGNGSSSGPRS